MRILISNPDTIGDVVLRQPMFAALREAGHELMLVVQPMLAPIMDLVAPGARIEVCGLPAYDPRLGVGSPELEPLAAAAAAFDPDVFVVAPYQWTVLEERLAFALPRARCIAMSGRRYGDLNHGPAPRSRMEPAVVVEVARDLPELRKNERMASVVLGRSLTLPDPVLAPGEAHAALATAALARQNLAPGGYWLACVGDSGPTAIRNWGAEDWGGLLGRWASEHDEKFLFVGLESESETVGRVRAAMGGAGASLAEWTGREGGDLETLVGLIAQSRGYIGRDTGPMHIAAALDKPVAAVFGGGTWPRFVPAGRRSVAVTVGVPCIGCGWRCHLPESYCIKRVPAEAVWKAVGEVRSGKVREPRARVLGADVELLTRIGREGAETARVRLVQASVARRELAEERKSMSQSGAAVEGSVETLYGPEPKPGAFRESRREEPGGLAAQAAQWQSRLHEAARLRGEQSGVIESLREQLSEAKARARDLENRMERRLADLLTATAETATFKERFSQLERTLAAVRREGDQARQQGDEQAVVLRKSQAEAQQARAELGQVRQQSAKHIQEALTQASANEQAAAALRVKIVEMREVQASLTAERDRLSQALTGVQAGGASSGQLTAAQQSLGKAEADLHDLRARAQRLEADRTAMAKLARQHETRIEVLQSRLNDLMASRWRRYGQKAGIVMTLPWEYELRNGQA